jgi:hypothetical protein
MEPCTFRSRPDARESVRYRIPLVAVLGWAVMLIAGRPAAPASDASSRDADRRRAATNLDPAIHTVVSGGCWSRGKDEGYYRVIVYEDGFEEVSHHVVVQLIRLDFDRHGFSVVMTVPIAETRALDLAFRELRLTSVPSVCGPAVYEATATRRTLGGSRTEHVTLRVEPSGSYAVTFEREPGATAPSKAAGGSSTHRR